jgi:hypothetical protein
MAAASTTTISNVIVSILAMDRIRSQINRSCTLLSLLPIKLRGSPMSWSVKFRGRTAAAGLAQTANAPAASTDIKRQASLTMGEYADTASVTGLAQSAAAMAANPLAIAGGADLMMDEIKDAVGNIAETLGGDIYSGTGGTTDPIIGLATAIDSSGTYANIDSGTYTEWASTESTGLLANISFEMLRTFLTAIHTLSGRRPNLCVTTPTVLDAIRGLFANYPSYVDRVPLGANGAEVKLVSGTRALYVENCWFIDDTRCTSNTIYALNLDEIELSVMPHAEFTAAGLNPNAVAAEFARVTGDPMNAEEAAAFIGRAVNGGLIPYIKQLGATGNQDSKQVIVYAQLRPLGRKFHGKLTLS